ncbi:MAG: hypothetical protein HY420_02470 [Candidatus Kerfeldbacteria bacterium]|nr:hypothetical protein [Candidatus Kerfeldbacteria bacterium]
MDILTNIVLPLIIPIGIIFFWIVIVRNWTKGKRGWWNTYRARSDWQTSLGMGVIFLFFSIVSWFESNTSLVPFFQAGSRWRDASILLFIIVWQWIYVKKIRRMSWRSAFLNVGLQPRDERETMMILKATQLGYASTVLMLLGLYLIALFLNMPSKSSFVFLIVTIVFFSKAIFSYSLDRSGYPDQS